MNVGIIIQARMGSTRLPGKSLALIEGKPLIQHVVDRVRMVQTAEQIILATTDQPEDDTLAAFAKEHDIDCFRGDEKDVQKRYFDAAVDAELDVIVRVTGDNPLIDPILIDALIALWQREGGDYIGCTHCIVGMGSELFTFEAFERARALSTSQYDREHVTPPFYNNPSLFTLRMITPRPALQLPDTKITVDTQEDLEQMRAIYRHCYRNDFVAVEDAIVYRSKQRSA